MRFGRGRSRMEGLGFIDQVMTASSDGFELAGPSAAPQFTDDLTAYSKKVWLREVRQRLGRMLRMPIGWDGYNAPRISNETALFTAQVLTELWRPNLKAPDITALSSGGLAVEWVSADTEFTLEVEGPYAVTMIYEGDDGDDVSESVGADLTAVIRKIEHVLLGANQLVPA